MEKASPFRFLLILLTVALALYHLIPRREVVVGAPSAEFMSPVKVRSEATGLQSKAFYLEANASGNVGETENLTLSLLDQNEQLLKDGLDVGQGYTGSVITPGGGLPLFSLGRGSLEKGARQRFDYHVEFMSLGLDLIGGSEIVYGISNDFMKDFGKDGHGMTAIIDIINRKLNVSGLKDIFIQSMGENQILIQLPGLKKSQVDDIKNRIETQGVLHFNIVIDDGDPKSKDILDQAKAYRESGRTLPRKDFPYFFCFKKERNSDGQLVDVPGSEELVMETPMVSGTDIVKSDRSFDSRGLNSFFAVNIEFSPRGTKKFARATERNVNKRMAIILDGALISAPVINEPIRQGRCQITGNFTKRDSDNLVAVLRSGSMNVKLDLVSESNVGPSLGADSINSGILACLLGAIIVVAFMFIYYRKLGLVANIALLLNILLLLGAIAMGEGTLTLPGIAGIVLTIGMAVDANILIFERIREESMKKQHVKVALTNSYARAFITIFDSNFTTIITALVLFMDPVSFFLGMASSTPNVGSAGPVKGFCLTLMLPGFLLPGHGLKHTKCGQR
ncbi:MAG: protein translocase subunit SecD, partial [Planctomycetes bacterium]|nr:protein translocase subunit SecD [Planctomycetota bacterium]